MEHVRTDAVESTEAVDGAHLSLLAGCEKLNVRHFVVEPGARVPEHSHLHEQAGFVHEGTLVFLVDGEEISVKAGESYVIPGEEVHAPENRGGVSVRGIDVFSPPRLNPDWKE